MATHTAFWLALQMIHFSPSREREGKGKNKVQQTRVEETVRQGNGHFSHQRKAARETRQRKARERKRMALTIQQAEEFASRLLSTVPIKVKLQIVNELRESLDILHSSDAPVSTPPTHTHTHIHIHTIHIHIHTIHTSPYLTRLTRVFRPFNLPLHVIASAEISRRHDARLHGPPQAHPACLCL